MTRIALLFGLLYLNTGFIFAQDSSKVAPPKMFVTEHQGKFGGQTLDYTATAKETYLKDSKDRPVASIWSVAYTVKPKNNTDRRPVTFVFNGFGIRLVTYGSIWPSTRPGAI